MKFKNLILAKRKLLVALFSLLLGSFILTESILAERKLEFEVQEGTLSAEATEAASLEPAPEVTEEVDYYLPYPGILPDHPLYWLKMIRDRVLLWLTRNPAARLERLLLYADKRVGAAEALIKGGKVDLGITTASKAEKYLEQAIEQLEVVEEKVEDVGKIERLREKLGKATLKHTEVLEGVWEKVPNPAKPALERAIEYSQRGHNRVMEVMERKMEKEAEKIERKLEKEPETEAGEREGEELEEVTQ